MTRYELTPKYNNQKSFYKKAIVEETEDTLTLYSYDTPVAEIYKDTERGRADATVYNMESRTTVKHIKEFLLQNSFRASTKSQIKRDYKPYGRK